MRLRNNSRKLVLAILASFLLICDFAAVEAAPVEEVLPTHSPAEQGEIENPELVGLWFYTAKILDGTRVPEPPTATLRLFFEFFENSDSRLYWYHVDEDDWCERRGRFSSDLEFINDHVVWLNPHNSRQCSRDPDMQLGRHTRTRYAIVDGELQLFFQVGDVQLIMVWRKLL